MVTVHQASLTTGVETVKSPNTIKPSSRATNFHAAATSQSGGWMFTREEAQIRDSTL